MTFTKQSDYRWTCDPYQVKRHHVAGRKVYGCHNKDHQEGYWVKDGVIVKGGIGIQIMKYIKDTSSRECRYDMRAKDKRCEGCGK